MYLLHIYPPPPRYSTWLRVERERTEGCKGNTLPDQVCRTRCDVCSMHAATCTHRIFPPYPTYPTHTHTHPHPHPHTPHRVVSALHRLTLPLCTREGGCSGARQISDGGQLSGQGRENACMACVHACMHAWQLNGHLPFRLLPFAFAFCTLSLLQSAAGAWSRGRR